MDYCSLLVKVKKVNKYALLSRNTVLLTVIPSRQNLPPRVLLCGFGCP